MPDNTTATGAINITLSPNNAMMELRITGSDDAAASVSLSAAQVDKLVAHLSGIRSRMTPEVPRHFPQGKPVHVHGSTTYCFAYDPLLDDNVLAFRHSGLGWISFQFSETDIEEVHDHLPVLRATRLAAHSSKKH